MKKILIFSLTYFPKFIGGAEIAVHEITNRIPEDFEFHMITARFDSTLPRVEKCGTVSIHRIGPASKNITLFKLVKFPWYLVKILFPALALFYALKLHRKEKFHLSWAIMTYMSITSLFLKMFMAVPYIITLQDGDTKEHIIGRKRIAFLRPLIRKAFGGAECVTCISNYLAEFAKQLGAKKTAIVPNGVDGLKFKEKSFFSREEREKLKSKLGIMENEEIVITTSRLVKKNGIDNLIEALSLLPNHVKLLIIGQGELENELRKQAKEAHLSGRIIFLGFVSHDEIPKYLSISSVFCRPSVSEGLGSSFLEAMAVGVPVIGTGVGGIPDILIDGETGLMAESGNAKSVAAALLKILNDDKLRVALVERAQGMIQRKYTWDKVSCSMREILEGVTV